MQPSSATRCRLGHKQNRPGTGVALQSTGTGRVRPLLCRARALIITTHSPYPAMCRPHLHAHPNTNVRTWGPVVMDMHTHLCNDRRGGETKTERRMTRVTKATRATRATRETCGSRHGAAACLLTPPAPTASEYSPGRTRCADMRRIAPIQLSDLVNRKDSRAHPKCQTGFALCQRT